MSRFYGFTVSDLMDMDVEAFFQYSQAIEKIEAMEQLKAILVSDFPHLKKERRQKLHRQLHKAATFETESESIEASTLDFAKFLTGASHGR